MAVKRVWFSNIPSNELDVLDRSQVIIGFPVSPIIPTYFNDVYLRRYLGDPEAILIVGPPITEVAVVENIETNYLRRYLDDPVVGNYTAYFSNIDLTIVDLVPGTGIYSSDYVCPIGTDYAGTPPIFGFCGSGE